MKAHRFTAQFASMVSMGTQLCEAFQGDAILIMLEGPTDWEKLLAEADGTMIVVAAIMKISWLEQQKQDWQQCCWDAKRPLSLKS